MLKITIDHSKHSVQMMLTKIQTKLILIDNVL